MVYTSPTKVARIVSWDKQNIPRPDIARNLNLHRTTVTRILKRYEKSQDFYFVNPKSGRPRIFHERDARVAALMLARTQAANVAELQKEYFPDVGAQTIRRRLREHGLICRVRKAKPYLSPPTVGKRDGWGKEHLDWTVADWEDVVFSDESKFQLFKSDGRQYAWYKAGQAYDDRYVKKTIKHGGGRIMVWGCISAKGMGRLYRIDGIMRAPDYVEILEDALLGSLKDLKLRRTGNSSIIFQQDNDPKHTSKLAQDWFKKKRIRRLDWPPSSPDMNIIEHVWDQLDALIRARRPLPRNADEMWAALQEEWRNFPMESIRKLYESLPRRVAALVEARGGHTKY